MGSPPDPLADLFWLVSIFQFIAAVLAIFLARQRREHCPVAVFMAFQVGANAVHEALRVFVLVPARAGGMTPFTGWTRVAGHLATAVGLTWSAGLAAVALIVLMKWRPRSALALVVPVWLLVSGALALAYPAMRGPLLARALLAGELAGVAVMVGGVVAWVRRGEQQPQSEHVVLVMLLMAEVSTLLVGPWRSGEIYSQWPLAQMAYAVIYMVLVAIQGGYLSWVPSSR